MGLEPIRTNVHWILSPTCLPIPPLEPDRPKACLLLPKGMDKKNADMQRFLERKKGFEPSTSTLAR